MDGRFETGVFISQLVDRETRGWRHRRRTLRAYGWHLIHPERPGTLCGLDMSYSNPRRPWSAISEKHRCVRCAAGLERMRQTETRQATA
jgi:hypothetical protein